MSIVSYAQNFEDVMLWRALADVSDGFYIDVGAQHPIVDSVSKAFYEQGWRGIHVEATPRYAELLRQDRRDETVLQVALAEVNGVRTFYEIPDTGLSTGDLKIADRHREKGLAVQEVIVPCMTLSDLFALTDGREIHWLKIDVEGMEREVLNSWEGSPSRPWVVVVESTLPNTQIESHDEWEYLLLDRGYKFVYFDGLNRFYISENHAARATVFRSGPNVFDGFSLSGEAQTPFCSLVNSKAKKKQGDLEREINHLRQQKDQLEKTREESKQKFHSQIQIVERKNQYLIDKLAVEGRAHIARERALSDLASQASQKSRFTQESLLQEMVKRERDCAQQIFDIQKQSERERSDQFNRLKQDWDERADALADFERQASLKVEHLQRTMIEREEVFSNQLRHVGDQSTREKEELARLYREEERSLRGEVAIKEWIAEERFEEACELSRRSEKELAERKAELDEQILSIQEQFRREKLAIESAFDVRKEELAREKLASCDALRTQVSSAERALVTMIELSEQRDKNYDREAKHYLERIDTLEEFIARRERMRLRKSDSIFRKVSPVALNVVTVARMHNIISMLDNKFHQNSEIQRINMSSQSVVRVNYQPTFEPSQNGSYDLDEFRSLYDRNFVRAAYLAILRREPDPEGELYYLEQVRAGIGKDEILDSILKSQEAKKHKTVIRGLGAARTVRKMCRIPFFGKIFVAMLFLVELRSHLQDLRALENHVIRIAEESHKQYREVNNNLRSRKDQ